MKKQTKSPSLDNKQPTIHTAWHMVAQAKEKHKAGWRERGVLGTGTMAGPALEWRPEGSRGKPCGGAGEGSRQRVQQVQDP